MTQVYIIGLNTFRESIRSKVMYSLLFFAIVVVLVATMFGSVTIGDQLIVIKDFGLFSLCLFAIAYTVISGAALLHKELARKTIYNILAKPVERWQFVVGKFVGMLATVTFMLLCMGSGLILFIWLYSNNFDFRLLSAFFAIICQLTIVCAAAIFFSSIVVTPLLSGAFTFGLFLAGRSTEYLLFFIEKNKLTGLSANILEIVYWLLPHLDTIDISDQVVYQTAISGEYYFWSFCYTVGYTLVLLILANICFHSKEFN